MTIGGPTGEMSGEDVRVCADARDVGVQAAAEMVTVIANAVRSHGRCSLVLSGGSTPRALYELLASTYRDRLPWPAVHLFWGDERFVPLDDRHSNYRMAKEALLDHVPCPAANVHPMPTKLASPDAAALTYEQTLRETWGGRWPRFDLLLLGLGEEGHTASLFPGSPAIREPERWVAAVTAPVEPARRLTLTMPVLTSALTTFVLATGARKAEALRRAVTGDPDPEVCPASALRQSEGQVVWWVDPEAAGRRQ